MIVMETIAVRALRRDETLEADLKRVRVLADLLDQRLSIAGFKFGLDAIIGLIPAVGDTIALAAAAYPLHLAHKHDLPKRVQRRMLFNIVVDYLVGIVPIAGDLFDAVYKANMRNLKLFEQAVAKRFD